MQVVPSRRQIVDSKAGTCLDFQPDKVTVKEALVSHRNNI